MGENLKRGWGENGKIFTRERGELTRDAMGLSRVSRVKRRQKIFFLANLSGLVSFAVQQTARLVEDESAVFGSGDG